MIAAIMTAISMPIPSAFHSTTERRATGRASTSSSSPCSCSPASVPDPAPIAIASTNSGSIALNSSVSR